MESTEYERAAAVHARLDKLFGRVDEKTANPWWEDEADHALVATIRTRAAEARARLAKLLGEEPQEETLPKAA